MQYGETALWNVQWHWQWTAATATKFIGLLGLYWLKHVDGDTWRGMTGSDAEAENCRTDIGDNYLTRRHSYQWRKWTHNYRRNWLWKREETRFETYQLYLIRRSEMHSTLSIKNCSVCTFCAKMSGGRAQHWRFEMAVSHLALFHEAEGRVRGIHTERPFHKVLSCLIWQWRETESLGTAACCSSGAKLSPLPLRPVVAAGRNWAPCHCGLL